MKNLLLASTALVAFAGAAAAEVTVSGQGRFGVVASNGADTFFTRENGEIIRNEDGAKQAFSSRLRVIFGMTFESDTGLTFGGSMRADNAQAANKGTGGSVFVSGDFGRLEVGDVDSGAKAAVGNISGIGYTGVGDYHEMFYLLGGGGDPLANDEFSLYATPAALYSYTTGGVTFYIGIGNPAGGNITVDRTVTLSTGTMVDINAKADVSQQYSVGVGWADDNFSAGIGYESTKIEFLPQEVNGELVGRSSRTLGAFYIGGSASFGGATFKAVYGDISDLDYSQYGMSVDYTFDAFTATAYFRTADYGDRTISAVSASGETITRQLGNRTAYGIGGTYDLGGGVKIKGGVADPDLDNTYWQADLGVTFNF